MQSSYILAYQLYHGHSGIGTTDHFEVFHEYNEAEESPLQQVNNRVHELQQLEQDEVVDWHLRSWNIANIIKTSEHYPTEQVEFFPDAASGCWQDMEVSPVLNNDGGCEVCDEENAEFWSVYLHQIEGGVQCIADLHTKKQAEQLAELIENAAKHYKVDGESEDFDF